MYRQRNFTTEAVTCGEVGGRRVEDDGVEIIVALWNTLIKAASHGVAKCSFGRVVLALEVENTISR